MTDFGTIVACTSGRNEMSLSMDMVTTIPSPVMSIAVTRPTSRPMVNTGEPS